MIKFPHNMTVDDNTASEEISFSAEYVRNQERRRIITTLNERIKDLESCAKDDGCQLRADGIRLAISDIEFKGEEK
jgi:hypothetical protein